MTRDTKYVCDGCGTESTDNSQWSHPFFCGYGNKDLCVFCTSRIACSLYDASGTAREVEIGRLQAELKEAEDKVAFLKKEVSDHSSLNEETIRQLHDARAAHSAHEQCRGVAEHQAQRAEEEARACSQIIQDLHEELKEARADHEYDADINRGLVLELLNMLGKKARRRNKKRLREIRLAVSMAVPGDDEVVS